MLAYCVYLEGYSSLHPPEAILVAGLLGARRLNMRGRSLRSSPVLRTRISMRLVQPALNPMTGGHGQALLLPAQKINPGETGEVQCRKYLVQQLWLSRFNYFSSSEDPAASVSDGEETLIGESWADHVELVDELAEDEPVPSDSVSQS